MDWLDAPALGAVMIFWNCAFAAIILGGLAARRLHSRIAVWLVMVAVIVLPPTLQGQVVSELGHFWQGRY
ncbi:hypothetical protein [Arthrobacter glacialis]|uniref:Uncharacterized protein n=1 Tax=Arthrobacter glacialis TaxID=1664 RepID=A0A2S3ZZE0_ARTGL|nr:hypothetical protein [Arthrobacter glacialis]POH74610.1 hypothetical protein CVS27_05170 [Arthrobacter glacialis]